METIYCLTHAPSGKRYVGRTKYNGTRRWRQHRDDSKYKLDNHSPLLEAIRNSRPEDWDVEDIAVSPDGAAVETLLIESYQTTDPEFGFNCKSGEGFVIREETHKRFREANRGEANPLFKQEVPTEHILLLYRLGFATQHIARMVRLTASAVWNRLKLAGEPIRQSRRVNGRFVPREIPILKVLGASNGN